MIQEIQPKQSQQIEKKIIIKKTNLQTFQNEIKTYNDYELNNLSYKNAIKIDKRNYIKYYFPLLRMKHLLIFIFYTSNDYNSKAIKISLFLFSFALSYTINTLFFDDNLIHKIYEDQGCFILFIKYQFYYILV